MTVASDVKAEIANEAVRIVTGARRSAYGPPENNFQRIARLQSAYMASRAEPDAPISTLDVPMLNLLQKVARICETPAHLDSYIDILGYAMCAAEIAGVDTAPLHEERDRFAAQAKAQSESIDADRAELRSGFTAAQEEAIGRGSAKHYESKLQIEAGKFYRTRGGRKVGPIVIDQRTTDGQPASGLDHTDGMTEDWGLDGSYWLDREESEHDLVAEWDDLDEALS